MDQPNTLGALGTKEQKSEEKHFGELRRKIHFFLSGSRELRTLSFVRLVDHFGR